MNIYLDTNILYTDPFFRSSYSQLLLSTAKDPTISIVIPKICFDELFFKLTTNAKNLSNEINNKISEFNRWTRFSENLITSDISEYESEIKKFYFENFENGTFILLETKEENFNENLEKAIKKIPPFFTEKKQQFRDGLIWSLVRNHATLNDTNKNYFITANYNDFWNAEKTDLHINLKSENKNILLIDKIDKLFELETILIDKKTKAEFQEWLGNENVSIEVIEEAIDKYLWNHIEENIDSLIKRYPIDKIQPNYELGFIEPTIKKANYKVEEIEEIVPIQDFAALKLKTSLYFEGKIFYPNYQKSDFSNFETNQFRANFSLSVSYDKWKMFYPISLVLKNIVLV